MAQPKPDGARLPLNARPFADPSEFSRERHREAGHAEARRFLARHVAPGGVGAELGVFWAHFAEVMLDAFRPAKLALVDPWHELFGPRYPDWGRYTNFGRLTTAETLARAKALAAENPGRVEVAVMTLEDFLPRQPDGHFDWIYLDARHTYEAVRAHLALIRPKMKARGVILGDDYYLDPGHQHAGVKRAVDEFAQAEGYALIVEDRNQFVLRPLAPPDLGVTPCVSIS